MRTRPCASGRVLEAYINTLTMSRRACGRPRPFLNVLSTLATLRVNVARYVLAGGVCEARLASVESAHLIVNHKLSACGCGTFSPLEDSVKAQAGKMHISFAGKMHISLAGKMH